MAKLAKPPARHEQVRQLYASGLSTRQVAALVVFAHGYVAKLCRDLARDRSAAAQLRQPMRASTHWRTCRQQARKLTERELGRKLACWEHVHHKNGDYTDQRRENREVLSAQVHTHTHRPPNPIPRWQRPARQAYMRLYAQVDRRVAARCPECHKAFHRDKYAPDSCCSRSCGVRRACRRRRAKA